MGTSRSFLKAIKENGDHPHAYGDKEVTSMTGFIKTGSSPRVWGQVNFGEVIEDIFRIIPTRMGTSFYMCSKRQVSRDHPHAYGDKFTSMTLLADMSGSSPCVWGQVFSTGN